MYYFSGALTIVWGILLYFALPPDPIRAPGFDHRQRYILIARLRNNNTGVRNTHFKSDQVWELLLDVKFWLMFSIAFLSMIANGPISTFVPIIINGFGFSTLNSLLLVMPAGAYAGTVQLLFPYLASKYKDLRSWIYLGGQLLTTLAALLLWLLPLSAKGALLFAVYILPSTGGTYPVLMGLQIANTAGYTKRSLASSGLYIGYCLGQYCLQTHSAVRTQIHSSLSSSKSFLNLFLVATYRQFCRSTYFQATRRTTLRPCVSSCGDYSCSGRTPCRSISGCVRVAQQQT